MELRLLRANSQHSAAAKRDEPIRFAQIRPQFARWDDQAPGMRS